MINITMLVFEEGHASTLIGPMEVFSDAGALWNVFIEKEPQPLFTVQTAAVTSKPVRPHGPVRLIADRTLDEIVETDLVFVPSVGLGLDEFVARNGVVIEWLMGQREKGAMIAGACAGVALLGEAGLLDGRRATTHWALVELYRRRSTQPWTWHCTSLKNLVATSTRCRLRSHWLSTCPVAANGNLQ